MSSDVDICNEALGHLGNKARVNAIVPPDGSAEAQYCAQYYPRSVEATLVVADWSFARTRATLGLLTENLSTVWGYAYALPSDCLAARRILTGDPTQFEDDSAPYTVEGGVIYTNQADAVLVYTKPVKDATKLSSAFVEAAGYMLASFLAGPIIKGNEGVSAKEKLRKLAVQVAAVGAAQDANSSARPENTQYQPGSLRAR